MNAQSAVWRYPSNSFRGWGGYTKATLKVICDLKYDQDICWMWSLVFIWWNWMCLLNIMRDFECDRDACWTWLIFDVLNVNVWNVHVECDVWPWIWSRCLLNLINFHVLNANVIVECDRYPCMWSNFAPFGLGNSISANEDVANSYIDAYMYIQLLCLCWRQLPGI